MTDDWGLVGTLLVLVVGIALLAWGLSIPESSGISGVGAMIPGVALILVAVYSFFTGFD